TGSAFGIDASGSNLIDNVTPLVSAGAGLSWRSPLGPLRFDFGFPLARQPHDRARLFNFRFGTRF
ncbi:MAG: BamA/TamA family outer membrane protein, partial [Rhodospirillaceae bacterium]|nr:BamA/TamA family outer membrane protein [Rhodospirillaceae bacterium]